MQGFPGVLEPACRHLNLVRDVDLIPGREDPLEDRRSNSLQCSCPGEPHEQRAWWALRGGTESDTTERLSSHAEPSGAAEVEMPRLKMLPAVTGGPLLCLVPGFRGPAHCLGCTTWPAGAHPAWRPGLTRSSGVQCCLKWLRRAQDRLPDLFSGTEHQDQGIHEPFEWPHLLGPPSSVVCHMTLHRPCDKVLYQKKIPSL